MLSSKVEKSINFDGLVKRFRDKARESRGMRRTIRVRRNDEG